MRDFLVIAGPCSLENLPMAHDCAQRLLAHGLNHMRASIFKMRTQQKNWRGLERQGVEVLHSLKFHYPTLQLVCEIRSQEDFECVRDVVDVVLVGTRNAQNFCLLEYLGCHLASHQQVILKRGMGNTVEEFLSAAEYLGAQERVILCERGIRTFETSTRNTLDLAAVAVIKTLRPQQKMIIDPSHSCGHGNYVQPLMCAAKAVGADGLLVEVHPRVARSRIDAAQAISFEEFDQALKCLQRVPRYSYAVRKQASLESELGGAV